MALLLWIPQGISTTQQPVVTGHSTFFDGKGYDPCLASIAGILKTDVRWFNDMVLAERYGGKGTYIYASENGSMDPTDPDRNNLWTEGVFYDFVDPNGVHWHVDEAFMMVEFGVSFPGDPGQPDTMGTPRTSKDRQYVWIVELSEYPIHDQFAGPADGPYYHDIYNFLLLIDTCKFHRNAKTNYWGAQNPDGGGAANFNLTHEGNALNNGHPTNAVQHVHESFMANLWIGRAPILVPIGASDDGATFQTEWAMSDSGQENAARAPGHAVNQTEVDT